MSKQEAVNRLAHAIAFDPATSIGPVAAAFFEDRSEAACIMGPIGSAKTSVSLMKMFMVAIQQEPNVMGVRYSKFAVIRDTYRNLWNTTIQSWKAWVPEELGEFTGGKNEPGKHHLRFNINDGTIVDMLVEFIAVGDNNVEDIMRGWEGTAAYLNEADRLQEDVFYFVRGRVGRYPNVPSCGVKASWSGVWADMNAPDEENYMAKLFIFEKPDSFKFFQQPGGREANAENIKNLPNGYYEKQIAGQTDYYIRRMIDNKLGYSRDGQPCYPEFNDNLHVAVNNLQPIPGLPIDIGFDCGLTPAGVIGQQLPNGGWRILTEIIADGIGAKRFGQLVKRVLTTEYRQFYRNIRSCTCDPAGLSKSAGDAEERSWRDLVMAETGLMIRPAPTNAITPRLDTVKNVLNRMIDGQPGFLLSPTCKVLRKGFNSGYKFKKVANSNSNVLVSDSPDKNEYSHPHDALQYLLCGAGEYNETMGRQSHFEKGKVYRANTTFRIFK